MSAKLDGLARITDLALRAEQTEMAAILAREDDLRENLAQLTANRTALAQSARVPNDAALIAGADIRWHHWVDQRRAVINTELAQVLALKENCRAQLRLAFGRNQAAKALLHRDATQVQVTTGRRAAYES